MGIRGECVSNVCVPQGAWAGICPAGVSLGGEPALCFCVARSPLLVQDSVDRLIGRGIEDVHHDVPKSSRGEEPDFLV